MPVWREMQGAADPSVLLSWHPLWLHSKAPISGCGCSVWPRAGVVGWGDVPDMGVRMALRVFPVTWVGQMVPFSSPE